MFENVIVGVDGRPTGRDAIELARHLVSPEGKLILANVHSGELSPAHAITPGLTAQEQKASHELLQRERAEAGLDADAAELVSFLALSPGRGLHDLAEERGADLLVVGSCGRGVLGRAMLGDDTRAALNGAPCAVAIAARGYAEHPLPLASIGVGYDASPESEAALVAARAVAAQQRAKLIALEVVSIPAYSFTGLTPPALGDTIEALVKDAKERLRALEDVEGRAVYGLPGEELAELSGEVNLLVVGSRNYGPLRRLVVGSTSDYLERHARCSLLALPRRARAEQPPAG
ncbi:MAG: universal stress protein [Solirubrobacteraceae bacterium]